MKPSEKTSKKNHIRLNHFISKYAFYSRRQADSLIKEKKVRLNDHIVHQMAVFVDPKKDRIKVGSKLIKPFRKPLYIAFHKPEKTLTTSFDPQGRVTVFHYFKKLKNRIFAVGRLDWNTEGLILLTNDGEFSYQLNRLKIPKTYLAKLDGVPKGSRLEKLKKGVSIPGGHVKALFVKKRRGAWVEITISEGKNRQLHYMFDKIGLSIKRLKRVAIGGLALGSLKKREARFLSKKDLLKISKDFASF